MSTGPARLASLVRVAVRAPSGDNTQPWRFRLDAEAGRIVFLLDESRDPSPMNAGQRMARMAVGAALENLVRETARRGGTASEESAAPPALAAVRVSLRDGRAGDDGSDIGDPAIAVRVTNRRHYDARPVPATTLTELAAATPPFRGVTTHWITSDERLQALGSLVGRADAAMFAAPAMLAAFLRKVRFDVPAEAEIDDGLSTGSLELTAMDRFLLPSLPRLPHGLLRTMGAFRTMGARSKKLVTGSAGLCLVVAPDGNPETDLVVGRAMERAWLALTEKGLATQPMMSLLVLENALDHSLVLPGLSTDVLAALRDDLRAAAPEIAGRRPAFLLRFGYAPPPSARVGRLPVEAVIERDAAAG